jgi:hypothetical protein
MHQMALWSRLGRNLLRKCCGDDGQGMTEYVFVLAILVLAIGAVSLTELGTTLGAALSGAISRVVAALGSAS